MTQKAPPFGLHQSAPTPMGNSEANPSSSSGAVHAAAAPPSLMVGFGSRPRSSPTASDAAATPSLMGGFGARPRASDGAAPPSLMNPVVGSTGAKPRASPAASDGAAPPSLVNPMGASPTASDGTVAPSQPVGSYGGANSPTAPSSSSTNLAGGSGTAETTTKQDQYPRRSGVADCSNYVKFGNCTYGAKCWFNHPDPHTRAGRQSQASKPSDNSNRRPDLHSRGGGGQSQASKPPSTTTNTLQISKPEVAVAAKARHPIHPSTTTNALISIAEEAAASKARHPSPPPAVTASKARHPTRQSTITNTPPAVAASKARHPTRQSTATNTPPAVAASKARHPTRQSTATNTPPASGGGVQSQASNPSEHNNKYPSNGGGVQSQASNHSEHNNKYPSSGGGVQSQASNPSEHNNKYPVSGSGQSQSSKPSDHSNKQKYFPGKGCSNNRHVGKNEVEQVKMNFIGLPLRPGAGLCLYYMHRGTCKFGTNCKFHHPDPKSEPANSNALRRVVQKSSQQNCSSEPVQRAQNEQSPLVTSPTSETSRVVSAQGDSTCTEQSAYKHGNSCFQIAKPVHYTRDQLFELREVIGISKDILELKRDIDVELARDDSNVSSIQRGNISDRDEVLTAVKGILDNLTPEKFDLVKDQLIEAGISRDDILEDIITVMFEKAVSEPTFCPMYAQLCSYLNKKLPSYHLEEPDGKETAFTSVLLNNCHEVFEGAGNLCSEIDRLNGLDQEMETRNKEIMLMKLRTFGNIRLIGELLKQKIIIQQIEYHTVQKDENKQGKPVWDIFATKVFCDICTDEVLAGNRQTDHLNDVGYNNLYAKFNEKTKKGYNHEQFRSKWESLKKDYQTWKSLMQSEDDQGRDPKMNTTSASPEWWAKKMEAMPDCGKFRSAPLENVDLLNIMFEDMLDLTSSTTPVEANWAVNTTVRSEHGSGDENDIGIIDKEVNEQSKEAMLTKSSNEEPNSMKPETSCVHEELNHPVNSDENVNPRNSATSTRVDRAGSNISEVMELVVDAGVEEGSDEHFIATQLFVRPEYREMFLTLKTPRGRLGWLKKMCQVKV